MTVEKDGGVVGPPSTWTYTITDIGGRELGTSLTPERSRDAAIKYDFAASDDTEGLAYYNAADEEWHLLVAFDEIEQSDVCS